MAGGPARKSVYFFLLMFFSPVNNLRIVLVGKTGAGKSSSANTILGKEAFKVDDSADAVTMLSKSDSAGIAGKQVLVIDTPGLCSTSMDIKQVESEIQRCVRLSVPGPHVFLLVIKLGRFTQEEKSAVQWIQRHFGEEASKYTMVLFTGADQIMRKSVEEFLKDSRELQDLLDSCGRRYHVFNNQDKLNLIQVPELFQKIERMVKGNGGQHYTNEMYQEAERMIKEERRREEEEKKRQEEEKIRTEEKIKWEERVRKIREEEEEKRRKDDYWGNAKFIAGFLLGAGLRPVLGPVGRLIWPFGG